MLKLEVSGAKRKVESFIDSLRSNPQYNISSISKKNDTYDVTCQLEYNPFHKRVSTVDIVGTNGETVKIDLLDCMIVEVEEGITYISGKSYDIFS